MPVKYYKDSYHYPYAAKAILDTLLYYMANLLYPDEDYVTQSSKRMIRADFVNAGEEQALRRCIDTFKDNQVKFPFTAYAIDEDNLMPEVMSHYQVSGNYYSNTLGVYVKFIPVSITFPMMSFFNTASDYWRACQIMMNDFASVTRINVPIQFRTSDTGTIISTSFPVNLNYDVTKGSKAFAFDEHIRIGDIFNISHTITVQGAYIEFNMGKGGEVLVPYPVDSIEVYVRLIEQNGLNNTVLLSTETNYPTPLVTTTAPTEGETDFDVDSPIIINFNTSMNEDSVLNSLDVVPWFDYRLAWDVDSKQLVIDPTSSLANNTEYEITINNNAKSYVDQNLEEDFVLTFTTEA